MFYFVASPIGNLGDVTFRAKEILSEVDYVLAEDTRRTSILLNHLSIDKKVVSFHQHSEYKIGGIVADLEAGKNIALLSDAGTPGLCDPGGVLAAALLSKKLPYTALPGPSSLATLISLAPFSCSRFVFEGYFPKKKGREKTITEIADLKCPVFFLESPHRIQKTLELLKERLPSHGIFIGRELSKKFEELTFAKLADIDLKEIRSMGEFIFGILPPCQMPENNT